MTWSRVPDYRRFLVPGGTHFFTVVTYQRQPLFADQENIQRLRMAIFAVQREAPFRFLAGVVLPDHMHFLWSLPAGDSDYSSRLGRIKARFKPRDTTGPASRIPSSRQKHCERTIWQRRFWEHTIFDEDELGAFLDYIHYNPVKHGLATCPHAWPASSFRRWVAAGYYEAEWGCMCKPGTPTVTLPPIDHITGEPQ